MEFVFKFKAASTFGLMDIGGFPKGASWLWRRLGKILLSGKLGGELFPFGMLLTNFKLAWFSL